MPSPKQQQKVEGLSFPEAMAAVIELRRVSRASWNEADTYVHQADGWLCIHNAGDPTLHAWMVNAEDLNATDWRVV